MLPLLNRRILITRARGQASALATQLEALGATTIQIPTIEIAPPQSYSALDAALASIGTFDWLIFTSANAVEFFAARARLLKLSPSPKRVAAIGPATAKAILKSGIARSVDLIPPQAIAESLAESLLPHAPNSSMLLIRAAIARDILPKTLRAAGAIVTIAEAYRKIIPADSIHQLRTLFTTNPPDAITFTSASTAENLVTLLESASLKLPTRTVLASIGPITSQAMRDLSLTPTIEAKEATIQSLTEALAYHLSQ
jgi:uroporphyrinogen-III synthase